MQKKHALTPFAKISIAILVLAVVGGGLWFFGLFDGLFDRDTYNVADEASRGGMEVNVNEATPSTPAGTNNVVTTPATTVDTIRISLDEWIGWAPLLDANGGLRTQPGSINYRRGLDIEYVIINDADHSSSSLVAGTIHGAGYTINRYAFLYSQFVENGLNPVYIFTLYTSSGGDGIVAREEFTSIESLYGARIGVARFSESMTLVDWLIDQSSLTPEQRQSVKDGLIMFDTPDAAARAFFGGQLDAAATWQPYLFQAQESPGTHLLFDTRHATNLIPGGLIFDYSFVVANEAALIQLTEGMIEAYEMYGRDFTNVRSSMPMFSLETDADILEMSGDATLFTARDMVEHMAGDAQALFAHMSDIWAARGENADRANANAAFTDRIVRQLGVIDIQVDEEILVAAPVFTEEVRETARATVDTQTLLTMRADIQFEPNTAVVLKESFVELDRFVEAARLLDGAVILIEGNIANVQNRTEDTPAGLQLSEERARAVARYLQQRGVDPARFIIVGNGIGNQIASNDTEAGRILNRRTDLSFIIVE